jgi:hypothetical protein
MSTQLAEEYVVEVRSQTMSAAEPAAGVPGLYLSISIDTFSSHRLS